MDLESTGAPIQIAEEVPFSLPKDGHSGQLIHIPKATSVNTNTVDVTGKTILQAFLARAILYSMIYLPSFFKTDLDADLLSSWDRSGVVQAYWIFLFADYTTA